MHARKHKTLPFLKIDHRAHQHIAGTLFQKQFQALQLKGRIALQGSFGYVHSQRGASAARDNEYPDTVSSCSLLINSFLELSYCIVCQTYHSQHPPSLSENLNSDIICFL